MPEQIAPRRRAVLIAPGSDDRKASKALASTADEVVLDLEDAVAPSRKDVARELVARLISETGSARAVSVRVNAPGTEWFAQDLRACAALGDALSSVVVPKVESAADIDEVDRALGGAAPIQALIESPAGLAAVDEIASGPNVHAVVIGYADLGAALGRIGTAPPAQWLYVQECVLHAARSAGIQAVDGPHLAIADDAQFRLAARWTADLGFDGKWVIHPNQIDSVTDIFTPTAKQAEDARRVLDALENAEGSGSGAVQLDGRMLDEAVAVAARRVLSRTGA